MTDHISRAVCIGDSDFLVVILVGRNLTCKYLYKIGNNDNRHPRLLEGDAN